jgi:periplasmic protein TonB
MNSKFLSQSPVIFKVFMTLIACFLMISCSNQKKIAKSPGDQVISNPNQEQVFTQPDKMPEFPGGVFALRNFVDYNIRYPVEAEKSKIQGKVVVGFVVSKTGKVTNVKIIRGIDFFLDVEAMRVVHLLPDFIPGREKGKDVAVAFSIPINFTLK